MRKIIRYGTDKKEVTFRQRKGTRGERRKEERFASVLRKKNRDRKRKGIDRKKTQISNI